jgi:cell division septum initiation protein DivIVA
VAGDQERREGRGERAAAPRGAEAADAGGPGERRQRLRTDVRVASFPAAVRGYERRAVDAYVKRVNRVIAELEVGSSPQAAVRHALDRVGEQTSGVLQRARQAAEEIAGAAIAEAEETTSHAKAEAEQILEEVKLQAHQLRGRSKEEADEILARAKAGAEELMRNAQQQARTVRDQAEARLRELQADTDSVWEARRKLLEDLPRMATELMEVAGGAAARLKRPKGEGIVKGDGGAKGSGRAPAPRGQPQPQEATPEDARAQKSRPRRPAAPDPGTISSTSA